jgi:small-conductance mechanosensitive channel
MVSPMTLLSLEADVSAFITDYGVTLLAIAVLLVVMLYLLAYMTRLFMYLKIQESAYFDQRTLDVIHRILQWVMVGIFILVMLFVSQFSIPEMRGVLITVLDHVPAFFFVAYAILATFALVSISTRLAEYMRDRMEASEGGGVAVRSIGYMEVVLKYVIYTLGLLIAVVGGIAFLPESDAAIRDPFLSFLSQVLSIETVVTDIALILIVVIAGYVAHRFADSILEDVKARSHKFSPRVIDLFKAIARWVILAIGFQATQLVAVLLFITFIVTAVMASESLRNAFSGLQLMMSDPFDEGDRVKVLDDLVGDVVEMNLTMTLIRTPKGDVIHVPNSEIMQGSILNFSRSDEHPIYVDVAVPFKVPREKVDGILMEAARETQGVLDDPAPTLFAKDLGNSVITYQLVAYANGPREMKRIRSQLIGTIQDQFHKADIRELALET